MPASYVSRRRFLRQLLVSAAAPAAIAGAGGGLLRAVAASLSDTRSIDEEIFLKKYDQASKQALADRPFGEVVATIGMLFVGTPYVAHSLEVPGDEHLVTNLQAFDCTTFVENALALARCFRLGEKSFEAFKEQLRTIRYRAGTIDGYPSRLHYFSDWLLDNEEKGIVHDVTRQIGGHAYVKRLNFMSTHAAAYKQLANAGNREAIQEAEQRLSSAEHVFIPKDRVGVVEKLIKSGDVIGLTTSIAGLDFSHIGLAAESGGVVKFLHAPLSGGAVALSAGSLADYVKGLSTNTGIAVARPVQP